MTPGCAFCGIVAGEIEAEIVLDDARFAAFLDARPVFKGHVLLVPKEHVDTLTDLPADLRDGFLEAAQRLAAAVQEPWAPRAPSSRSTTPSASRSRTCTSTSCPARGVTDCAASSGRARGTPISTSEASTPPGCGPL